MNGRNIIRVGRFTGLARLARAIHEEDLTEDFTNILNSPPSFKGGITHGPFRASAPGSRRTHEAAIADSIPRTTRFVRSMVQPRRPAGVRRGATALAVSRKLQRASHPKKTGRI